MPSWNIHVAEVECLLGRASDLSCAVSSGNAFLFGNLVPDVFVGYMVPDIDNRIPYRITHSADPVPSPKPHEEEFWNEYVAPALEVSCDLAVRDMVLGAWVHLLADNTWNMRTNEYLDRIGGQPGEEIRIKKQADFDAFGKTLHIETVPEKTSELLEAARMFPQYPIDEDAVEKTIASVGAIVRVNPGEPHHAPYRLLTDEFFDVVFAESVECAEWLYRLRALSAHLSI